LPDLFGLHAQGPGPFPDTEGGDGAPTVTHDAELQLLVAEASVRLGRYAAVPPLAQRLPARVPLTEGPASPPPPLRPVSRGLPLATVSEDCAVR